MYSCWMGRFTGVVFAGKVIVFEAFYVCESNTSQYSNSASVRKRGRDSANRWRVLHESNKVLFIKLFTKLTQRKVVKFSKLRKSRPESAAY